MVRGVRRIIGWASATVTLLVLLFGYHTSTSSTLATGTQTAISSGPVAGSNPASGAGSPAATTDGASGRASGGSSNGSPGGSSGGSSTQVTGAVVQTAYGPVQVALTVSGGEVTGASALQYPDGDPRSSQISGYALPVLTDETVAAQSSSIDMVSGATYTSTGYVQSLQSALDRAGL